MISQYPSKILKILTIYSCILCICHVSHPYKLIPALQHNKESFIDLCLHGRGSIMKQWKLSYRYFDIGNLLLKLLFLFYFVWAEATAMLATQMLRWFLMSQRLFSDELGCSATARSSFPTIHWASRFIGLFIYTVLEILSHLWTSNIFETLY